MISELQAAELQAAVMSHTLRNDVSWASLRWSVIRTFVWTDALHVSFGLWTLKWLYFIKIHQFWNDFFFNDTSCAKCHNLSFYSRLFYCAATSRARCFLLFGQFGFKLDHMFLGRTMNHRIMVSSLSAFTLHHIFPISACVWHQTDCDEPSEAAFREIKATIISYNHTVHCRHMQKYENISIWSLFEILLSLFLCFWGQMGSVWMFLYCWRKQEVQWWLFSCCVVSLLNKNHLISYFPFLLL